MLDGSSCKRRRKEESKHPSPPHSSSVSSNVLERKQKKDKSSVSSVSSSSKQRRKSSEELISVDSVSRQPKVALAPDGASKKVESREILEVKSLKGQERESTYRPSEVLSPASSRHLKESVRGNSSSVSSNSDEDEDFQKLKQSKERWLLEVMERQEKEYQEACAKCRDWQDQGCPISLADLDRDKGLQEQGGSGPSVSEVFYDKPSESGNSGEELVDSEIVQELPAPSPHIVVLDDRQESRPCPSVVGQASDLDANDTSSAGRVQGVVEQVANNLQLPEEELEPAEDVAELSSFRKLVNRFKHKFPIQEVEPFDGLTYLEEVKNVQHVQPVQMCLSKHAKWRFKAINKNFSWE